MDLQSPQQLSVYKIGGISVEFPYKPYGSQLAFMSKVISTLDRATAQGHCHALLESPTGTGKSLSLLCSTLAWQHHYKSKHSSCPKLAPPRLGLSLTNPDVTSPPGNNSRPDNPFVSGGGFIPEPDSSRDLGSRNSEQFPSVRTDRASRQRITPIIFYASRTHSQISQLIREYRKTSYRVPMAVLASRKHYCTNKHVSLKENVDEDCKLLIKGPDIGCFEFKNAHKVKYHPSLKKNGCLEVHDIEDLVQLGRNLKGCSYFAARSMADDAQLVFCPYSYILNPIIRRAMEVDIKGSIVILDEAHNIEDMARDAGSVDIEEEALDALQLELGKLSSVDSISETYQPLFDMIQGIIGWIGQRKNSLEKREFEHYFSCWTGDKALRELQEAGISLQYFSILKGCATKAIKATSDAELEGVRLSGMSAITLEGLFSSLSYFFSGNGLNALDYQLALQRFVKRYNGHAASGWTHTLSLWCLNPAVVFREIADLSLSVILTSGTMSPMSSFASELGVQFEVCMEAPHVIDMKSQVWAAVVSNGPGSSQLNASYKTADGFAFQDALGASLEEICKVVPDGVLVFFPSYKLLEKLCLRWRQTGQWSQLNAQKKVFVEPRGKLDDFESILKGYYDSILGIKQPAPLKLKGGRKRHFKQFSTTESPQNSVKRGGAAFLAVCRGKVSEGIDFSDENARVVVIVGIPFPNKNDIQVVLKKRYNDKFKTSRNLLSGSEWYCHQAFRALNQAAGRCIRHKVDYGAIILLDERFMEERNTAYISKWLRKSIKHYNNFNTSLEELAAFFLNVKERFCQKDRNVKLEISDTDEENISSLQRKMMTKGTQRRSQNKKKQNDDHDRQTRSYNTIETGKTSNLDKFLTGIRKEKASFSPVRPQASTEEKEAASCCQNNTCDSSMGFTESASVASSSNSEDHSTITENPNKEIGIVSPSVINIPAGSLKNLTAVQFSDQFPDQLHLEDSCEVLSEVAFAFTVTPERNVTRNIWSPEPEFSSVDLSVNSCCEKMRTPISLQPSCHIQIDRFDSPGTESSRRVDHIGSMNSSRTSDQMNESRFHAFSAEPDHQKLNVPNMPAEKSYVELPTSSNLVENSTRDIEGVMGNSRKICCSVCGNALGLRERQFLVNCSLATSSKVYLSSFLKNALFANTCSQEPISGNKPANTRVVVADVSCIDERLCGRHTPQQGVWCEEDGCVFRTICCPFCTNSETYLGLQIMATDESNLHLLNKILFYLDRVEIRNPEALQEVPMHANISDLTKEISCSTPFEKYAYVPVVPKSYGGLSTTKSKLRLPKREV